jgi:choline dehydrogenase-like flavoprotein
MAFHHVNAVVVGAGAGGGIVAKELATSGLSVVLFERGRWQSFDDHDHDELISQRVTVLGNAFGPDDEGNPRVVKVGEKWRAVLPSEPAYSNNAACVGGGTLSYGGMAWRFSEQDFRMRTIYGRPDGSTLDDWPLTYGDLEPYYEKAEYEIGVAGEAANPFAAPRKKPYPMPPFPYNGEGRMLESSAKRLGLHPFPIPMLRNSVARDGRAACIGCRYCVGFACEVQAKCGTQNTVIPRATGNCTVLTDVVTRCRREGTGRACHFDKDGRLERTADLVVVSAPRRVSRLLLNSNRNCSDRPWEPPRLAGQDLQARLGA